MTKSGLVQRIAHTQPHLVERDVALAVNMMLEHMTACLAGGSRCPLVWEGRHREVPPYPDLIQRCCIQHLWIHARRGLKEMFDSNGSPIAKAGLKRIAQLYKIEDKIRGESSATRQFVRWTESAPLVNAFGVWLDEQRSRVSAISTHGATSSGP